MATTAKKNTKKSATKKKSKSPAKSAMRKVSASKSARSKPAAKAKSKAKAKVAAKTASRTSKPASRAAKGKTARIDPLNRKNYTAVTTMLTVRDVQKAADFYTEAFGFKLRGSMDGPEGSLIHAELRLRDTSLMLSPESSQMRSFSARTIGDTPATLYLLVENVDDVFQSAVAAGAQVRMPVQDMFWGDRCAEVADADGNKWMIATHKSEPTPAQMREAMDKMMSQSQGGGIEQSGGAAAAAGASDSFGSEY
jgi:uncharacterized glyoxalase superfamily protein PhnB